MPDAAGNTAAATAGHAAARADGAAVDIATGLGGLLQEALKALADAGEPDAACRLAARACALLRRDDPALWRRFNALLHRIGPKSGPVGTRGGGA